MTTLTLSRGATSVDVEWLGEAPDPILVYSASKPNQEINPVSNIDPRVSDQFQNVKQFTINGYLTGANAYTDARSLAGELIKPHSGGTALQLDLSNIDGFGTYDVAPSQQNAVDISYPPGQRDLVPVSFSLPVVDTTIAGSATETTSVSSVTPGNGGSVTLSNPTNGESLTISQNLNVSRTVGRPNSTIRPNPSSVTYIDKVRSAQDVFEVSGRVSDATARADSVTLIEDVLGTPLGRDSLTLTFDNNLYGYESFDVVPSGAESGRMVVSASEKGLVSINGLSLRVVTS